MFLLIALNEAESDVPQMAVTESDGVQATVRVLLLEVISNGIQAETPGTETPLEVT